eukprot:gene22712-biopygen10278
MCQGRVSVLPREAWASDASEFRNVVPYRSLRWLWRSSTSIPTNYFIRLVDTGCCDWRVWEVRAVLLLLAGYSARNVVFGALGALRKRNLGAAAQRLGALWNGTGLIRDWVLNIRDAHACPNDRALVQRALAHRDALVARSDRASFISGIIQPQMDQGALSGGLRWSAGRRVRFEV